MKSVVPEPGFQTTQAVFSAYIRDPFNNPQPQDVDKKRIEAYRELFFNNIESFLSSNFPVLRSLLNDQDWFELAQDFFSSHSCKTPYFSEIPEEFIAYLQQERNNPDDFPFLLELAHYEWVEMALSIAQEVIPPSEPQVGEFELQPIMLSPLAWPLAYQYPVHKISPQFIPLETPEQATFLLVYRDIVDDVHFIEINALTFQLLQQLEKQPGRNAVHYLTALVESLPQTDPDIILKHGLNTLMELAKKTIVLSQ
jgi:hypothetical protein